MSTPTQRPEGALIERLRNEARPTMSGRAAAATAGISPSRWTQIIRGYKQETADLRVPVRAPADTLARMARAVGATPDQLREVGREDAADELVVLYDKAREFREVKQQLGEIYDAMQRQPDEASVRAEGRIRSAARLLDSATDALAQRDHARAIEDLDTSVVVIRSTITAIEDIALQKGLPNADQSSTDTDPSAQSDASETGDEDEEAGDGEEVVRSIRPAHWDDVPPPPPIELADAASVGHKESDKEDDASE